jgi:hypothetical protein
MCSTNAGDPSPGLQPQHGTSALLANLRQPGPLGWKVQRTVVNMWSKFTRHQACCGHAGEPGC